MSLNPKNYASINKQNWNKRTELHVHSKFYDHEAFKKGKSSLNEIELNLLGSVKGKKILHLQCHFGQDSISLARLGADVVGLDISDKAIEIAIHQAETENAKAKFICYSVYDLPKEYFHQFDIVYSSYGVIGWLPDINKWASVIANALKPNGQFVFVEFHPIVWMFDNEFNSVTYNYNKSEPIIETEKGSYANTITNEIIESISWNHGLAEVIDSLLKNGLILNDFREYDYSPYNCLQQMEEYESNKFRIKKFGNKIPLVYSLVCNKS